MQISDYENFKYYYQQALSKLPKGNFYENFITHKVVHSAEVLKMGRLIISETPELRSQSADFKLAAERALLFHDIGRFEEGVLRYQAENDHKEITASSSKINHGELGYNTFVKDKKYTDVRILAAIKFHGDMIENVYASPLWQSYVNLPEYEQIKQILFLTRDADKLANLEYTQKSKRLYHDIFYRQLSQENRTAPLSESVLKQFFNNQTILFSTVVSFADRILMCLSWIYDINFAATLKICQNLKIFEYLLQELSKVNKNTDIQKLIENKINQTLNR